MASTVTGKSVASIYKERIRKIRELTAKATPRRVNFHTSGCHFMAYLLSSCGLQTDAIAVMTGLTEGQVAYALMKAEREERRKAREAGKPYMTARKQFRKGNSAVAKMIVTQVTGEHSQVKRFVSDILDKRGLYAPKAKGVLKD
jgi:hypothetical protein